jgi:hypothetical protein
VTAPRDPGVPLEQFITALTSQLDRAQSAMAIKARLGYPLTFAVKDLTLDLRAHLEMSGGAVQIRPAGPGDTEASTIHLALTTITRPMIEENTLHVAAADPDEPTLEEALEGWSPEERRRLEWAGVQTVSQLADLQRANPTMVEKVASIPAMRLRSALERAARPMVREVIPERPPARPGVAPAATRLRIRGLNLVRDGAVQVTLGGEPVRVLEASARELLVEPAAGLAGTLEVATTTGLSTTMQLLALDPVPAPRADALPGAEPAPGGYRDELVEVAP